MYICLCNALTDRRLKQAAAETDSNRTADIYAACGCRAQCGQCVKAILELLRNRPADAASQAAGAD